MKNIFPFFITFLVISISLRGQPKKPPTLMARVGEESFRVAHIGVENGLSQGSVYTIFKDSYGFMWFSSQEGFNRYDGLNFRIFRPDETSSTALWGSNVVGIIEDPHGSLWVGTEECLNWYNREKDEFRHVFPFDKQDSSIQSICYPFFADDREVWFYNSLKGIVVYDYCQGVLRIVDDRFRYQQNNLTYHSILRTPQGDLWLRSDLGLAQLPAGGGPPKFYFSDHPQNIFGPPTAFYSFRYSEKEGVLWLGSDGKIIRFDPANQQAISYPLGGSNMVFDLDRDNQGRIWVGTEDMGLLVFDPEKETFQDFTITGNHRPFNTLATVFIDYQGVTWVCSDPHGIYKIIPNYRAINLIRNDPLLPGGLHDSYVRAFTEDGEGRIWIGTQNGGVTIFDPETEHFDNVFNDQQYRLLPDTGISSLVTDQAGCIWIGTENGLACYDPRTGRIGTMHQFAEGHYRPDSYIRQLLAVENGKVYFTSETGLYEADYQAEKSQRLEAFQDTSLTTLYRDPAGRLYVASYFNGFYVVDPSDHPWQRLGYFLQGYNINCFHLDEIKGRLWLGTNKGIWEFAYQDQPFQLLPLRQFTVKDGLPSSYVYAILPDEEGNLWMSSNRGITRFNPQQGSFQNLGPKDGLQGYEFNTNAYLQASNGVLYFGGVEGMNFFRPQEVGEVPRPTPRVILTDLQVSGDMKKGIVNKEGRASLSLAHENNTFFLSFVAPEYFCDGEIQYRYRLTNFESQWSEPQYANTVRYIRVPPGDYVFQVQAMNCDSQWSEQPTSLFIRILAPWWQTRWAHVGYILVFVMLILGIYRFYVWRKLERQEALYLKHLDEYRNRLYTNITHEFRTPLTAILGMSERIDGQPGVRDLLLRNTQKLLDLVNQILELSRLEAGREDLRFIQADIQQFIRWVVEPFQPIAADNRQTLVLITEPDQVMMDFDPPKLERIIVNLLSNAIKFSSHGGTITLETHLDEAASSFFLRVTDTGPGIDPAHLPHIFDRFYRGLATTHSGYAEGSGIGLALVQELTNRLGGTIRVESEKGRGTTFFLRFPVSRKAPRPPEVALSIPAGYDRVPTASSRAGRADASSVTSGSGLPLILLVEDNPDLVSYLKLLLQNNYQILVAANGSEGEKMAVSHVPDLVISDVMMPGLDGCELCKKLKNDTRTSHIPIILLTAKAGVSARIFGLETGADVYLEKPFHEEELRVRVEQLLQLRRSLQQHYQKELELEPEVGKSTDVPKNIESDFLGKVRAIIFRHLSDPDFSVAELGEKMALSQPQLYRKLKALADKSPHQLIRDFRLSAAKEKLRNTTLNVKEVTYSCGFNDPDYFSRLFKEYFGITPTEYRRQNQGPGPLPE